MQISYLPLCTRVGLNVPHTLITGNKNDIEKINQDVSQVIAKPIQDVFELKIGNSVQTQRTETVANFSTIPDRFYYSLFQEKITKKYELRVFFIEEAFYACAIFSPATDGRDLYSTQRLARIVLYKLPQHLQEKLIALNKRTTRANFGNIKDTTLTEAISKPGFKNTGTLPRMRLQSARIVSSGIYVPTVAPISIILTTSIQRPLNVATTLTLVNGKNGVQIL